MAEAAAPAAVAAPSATPGDAVASVPTSGTSVPDSGTTGGALEAPARDTTPRLAKPLKPIPSLPGVFPDEDPFPASPSDPAQPGTSAPSRGPDGRFLASPSSASSPNPLVGEHAPQPGQPDPSKAERFTFAGEQFDSREAAEQNFKSLRGQYRPLQSLARSLGGIDKIAPTLTGAAESARGWKAEADRLRTENDALRSGRPASPDVSATTDPAAAADEGTVDWEMYAEIQKLAAEQGAPWKAEQWLIEQTQKAADARWERKLDERFKPVADAQAYEAVRAETANLFNSLAGYTNADGSVAFPELHDEAAAYEVGRTWAAMGLPPDAARTPQGAVAAIAIYRMAKGSRSQASPATPAATTSPTAPIVPTDANAAAALDGGQPSVFSVPGANAPSAEAQRILAGLRSANSGNRALLGFDA